MTKKKMTISRVIRLSPEANIRLKEVFIAYEKLGIKKTIPEICDQIFDRGISQTLSELNKK